MAIVKVYDFNLISPATSIPLFHMVILRIPNYEGLNYMYGM